MSLASPQELPALDQRDPRTRPSALRSTLAALLARVQDRHARAKHARVWSTLDARQRADAGFDPEAGMPARPILEVPRGLMARLMEMR